MSDFLLVPPSISGSDLPSEMGVLLNESIQLVCRVQGTPPPTVQWLKDGEVIKNVHNKDLRYSYFCQNKQKNNKNG